VPVESLRLRLRDLLILFAVNNFRFESVVRFYFLFIVIVVLLPDQQPFSEFN